jgi:hypothetical protein
MIEGKHCRQMKLKILFPKLQNQGQPFTGQLAAINLEKATCPGKSLTLAGKEQ